ncbi:MAG: LutC/YkgG family protein [Intrasporangium sp.]|uniref:LutC/YkgG family protein n=1 Tax=Intrasporangium sp. TaxID=1925024 RepID=UPI003F80280D
MTRSAKDEVLSRVRRALAAPGTHHARTDSPERAGSGIPTPTELGEVVDLFAERVADYRAVVERVGRAGVAPAIVAALAMHGAGSVVVPDGLDDDWAAAIGSAARLVREPDVTDAELDHVDAVVSTAAVGMAVPGTIVLDHGPGQGRRALTLVPDCHVCVVQVEQVVGDVPDGVARLRASVEAGRALTWISGPSATSDIELERVEGVHGPRILHVLIVE